MPSIKQIQVSSNTYDIEPANSQELTSQELTFDTTPTSGSTNPVTSGGIYTAVLNKADTSAIKDSTITITQGGSVKGSFTLNQNNSATIALDSGGNGSAGTLNTTNTTAQATSASESLGGTVNLHKIAKTGTYSDLIGTPANLVTTNTAQTISGTKTFTSSAAFSSTSGVTLSSNLVTNSSAGTAGQVLVSRGTGLSPEWKTVSGSSDCTHLKLMFTSSFEVYPGSSTLLTIRPQDMASSANYDFVKFEYLIIQIGDETPYFIPREKLFLCEMADSSSVTGLQNPILETSDITATINSYSIFSSEFHTCTEGTEAYEQFVLDLYGESSYTTVDIGIIAKAYNSFTTASTSGGIDY